MIYAIVFTAVLAVTAGAISLWNIWVLNMHRSGGPYAYSTGAYTYRKFGIWHIGFRQNEATVFDMKANTTSTTVKLEKSELSLDKWVADIDDEWEGEERRCRSERQPISTT